MSADPALARYAAMIESLLQKPLPLAADGATLKPAVLDQPFVGKQSSQTIQAYLARQQPNGSFVEADPHASPELAWYRELQILHAVGSYYALSHDLGALDAIYRCADYCLAEIQPDHATTEPWAIYPLLLQPHTRPLVDQILHSYQLAHPAGGDALGAILLSDALVGLRALSI